MRSLIFDDGAATLPILVLMLLAGFLFAAPIARSLTLEGWAFFISYHEPPDIADTR